MNAEEKKSAEYLEGFFEGTQKMREIFEKCADDADKLNYDRGRHDAELELALTIEDIGIIHGFLLEGLNYTEVLRKFNETKSKK